MIVTAASRAWRRRLGPLAWAALEDLTLAAHRSDQGWVAPIGVRDIAAGVGVTKDTAARAVAALGAAGLVVLQRVQGRDSRWRSGYLLDLPDGIELRDRPNHPDTAHPKAGSSCLNRNDGDCPTAQDSRHQCPAAQDSRRQCPNNQDSRSPKDTGCESCLAPPDTPALAEPPAGRPAKRRPRIADPSSHPNGRHTDAGSPSQPTLFTPTDGETQTSLPP
jgi:hypothetical protein